MSLKRFTNKGGRGQARFCATKHSGSPQSFTNTLGSIRRGRILKITIKFALHVCLMCSHTYVRVSDHEYVFQERLRNKFHMQSSCTPVVRKVFKAYSLAAQHLGTEFACYSFWFWVLWVSFCVPVDIWLAIMWWVSFELIVETAPKEPVRVVELF